MDIGQIRRKREEHAAKLAKLELLVERLRRKVASYDDVVADLEGVPKQGEPRPRGRRGHLEEAVKLAATALDQPFDVPGVISKIQETGSFSDVHIGSVQNIVRRLSAQGKVRQVDKARGKDPAKYTVVEE